MISHPDAQRGVTILANLVDYNSTKITLSTVSSYDAELHSCQTCTEVTENIQAILSELSSWLYSPHPWSTTSWLSLGPKGRSPTAVVIDAKGLWTRIQSETKQDKRGTIYVRRMMESLERLGARVFWTNAGHMLADGLANFRTRPS